MDTLVSLVWWLFWFVANGSDVSFLVNHACSEKIKNEKYYLILGFLGLIIHSFALSVSKRD